MPFRIAIALFCCIAISSRADQSGTCYILANLIDSGVGESIIEFIVRAERYGSPAYVKTAEFEGYGKIKRVHLEGRQLFFTVDGKKVEATTDMVIRISTPVTMNMLHYLYGPAHPNARDLLLAQSRGRPVTIREFNNPVVISGRVTGLRMEGTQLVCEVNGKRYTPFHRIEVFQ